MKLSAKTEYACIAMLELAANWQRAEPVRIREIADQHQIPSRFLVQILLQLKGAGLVASTRGASGGYQLLRAPQEITLDQVISVMDGPPAEEFQTSANPESPAVRALARTWHELARIEQQRLGRISLAQLVDRMRRPEPMYYI